MRLKVSGQVIIINLTTSIRAQKCRAANRKNHLTVKQHSKGVLRRSVSSTSTPIANELRRAEKDDLVNIVKQYKSRTYDEDLKAIEDLGGK